MPKRPAPQGETLAGLYNLCVECAREGEPALPAPFHSRVPRCSTMSRSKVLEERLCRIARGSVLEPALAEDVVQDASLAALRARAWSAAW